VLTNLSSTVFSRLFPAIQKEVNRLKTTGQIFFVFVIIHGNQLLQQFDTKNSSEVVAQN
jgi:hypothetical protein